MPRRSVEATQQQAAPPGMKRRGANSGTDTPQRRKKGRGAAPDGAAPLPPRLAPVDRIERRRVDSLVRYAKNPRLHSDEQVAQIAASMREFGQTQIVVIDGATNEIIAGHGRVLAAELNGWERVTVGIALGWTEAQKRAYRILDNQLALTSTWQPELLHGEVIDLQALGFNLELLGFEAAELEAIVGANPGQTDPDAVPAPSPRPIVRRGEVWVLGRHRLMCGDATSRDDVDAARAGALARMVFTDPPYGVKYRDTGPGAWNAKKLAKKRAGTLKPRFEAIANDELSEEQLLEFLARYMLVQPLAPKAAQYVCHGSLRAHVFRDALLRSGYAVRAEIIWAKSRPGFNFAHYKHQHEPIYYAAPVKGTVNWFGDRKQTTLWAVASESGADYDHPTQKPVGLAVKAIENSSRAGDVIYEPFSGSGSTIIAAEMTARRCVALELDPSYVQVAIERWQNFTGQAATLDGRAFAEVEAERKRKRRAEARRPSRVQRSQATRASTAASAARTSA